MEGTIGLQTLSVANIHFPPLFNNLSLQYLLIGTISQLVTFKRRFLFLFYLLTVTVFVSVCLSSPE